MLWVALLTMVCATLAQHLGLTEKIAQIGSQILICPKCLPFWGSLAVLFLSGCEPLYAAGLSLFMAYVSNWMGFIYIGLNKIYSKLWQKVTKEPDSGLPK